MVERRGLFAGESSGATTKGLLPPNLDKYLMLCLSYVCFTIQTKRVGICIGQEKARSGQRRKVTAGNKTWKKKAAAAPG